MSNISFYAYAVERRLSKPVRAGPFEIDGQMKAHCTLPVMLKKELLHHCCKIFKLQQEFKMFTLSVFTNYEYLIR